MKVYQLIFSADSKIVIQAREGNELKGWDVATGKICLNMRLKGLSEVTSICTNADSSLLGIVKEDTTIEVFDLETGSPILKQIVSSFHLTSNRK